MASAEGDDGGPRVTPHDAGDGTEPGREPAERPVTPAEPDPAAARHVPTQLIPSVPTSGAPVGTNAEPLPMISPTSGAPIIRAVAKRPPTALPALGGSDGPSDVPYSARVTADRRRQAAMGVARPVNPGDPSGAIPRPRRSIEGNPPTGRATAPDPRSTGPGPTAPDSPLPSPNPPPSSNPPPPWNPPPTSAGPSRPGNPLTRKPGTAPPPSEDGWTSFGAPPAKPGLWRLPAPDSAPMPQAAAFGKAGADGRSASSRAGEIAMPQLARHAVDEPDGDDRPGAPPRHARPAPATVSEADVVEASIVTEAAAAPPPGKGALLAATSLLPRIVEAEFDGRALPPVLDADSWDDEPPDPIPTDDYLGRRRPARLPLRIWLVVGLVLLGLGAAAVIPQLLSPARDKPTATGPLLGPDTEAPPATSGGELIQPASAGGSTTDSATTHPAGSATTPGSAAPVAPLTTTSTTTQAKPPPAGPPPPPGGGPFSLTLSAIDTHSFQSWQRQDGVCGGSVVLVGAWVGFPAPPGAAPGTLTFSNITVPDTGSYNLAITYAITVGGSRNATITLNGAGVGAGGSFPSACTGTRTVPLNFTKTSGNTIVFSNPSSTAPSIMRIVISKP
jgi:hypothetical protein